MTKKPRRKIDAALKARIALELFTVLLEDSAAIIGLLIALVGLGVGQWLETPYTDGAASVAIGILLAVVAAFLAYESKGLLGEAVQPKKLAAIRALIEPDPSVAEAVGF